MDPLRTEEDQIQALKRWWSENGVSTVLSVVVAVSAVLGWRSWQAQQEAKAEAAAYAYQNLQQAVALAAQAPDDIKIAEALHAADTIKEEFSNTGYALFAALAKAKQAVADKDYDTAASELRWVMDKTDSTELREIASLRLARVLLSVGDLDAALAEITQTGEIAAGGDVFAAQKAELAGDIYVERGAYQQAFEQYKLAETIASEGAQRLPLLAVKMSYAKSHL
ncbi:MAG: tetratricopeptide repeat protein [Pseudomonadales bacterium]